ncbi:SHOCT domain-containing protein [Psychroserpens sp. Hel_I_66]|uniref:SHOCT domain-containing protein n=1 Tax=Psychroserpens sp. Hel_I_66 TaxID=1250004 RepID=UPI00064801C2|nr:SHOCT domain-containing protein [Psychroserpens sp. Hel_I_66]
MYPRKFYPEAIIFSILFTSLFLFSERYLAGQDMPSEDILEFMFHIPGALPILFFSILYVSISKRGTGEFGLLWYIAGLIFAPLTLFVIGIIGAESNTISKKKAVEKESGINSKVSELKKMHANGVIDDSQYQRNLNKLNDEQSDFNLKQSSKYIDLCKALENDYITQEEFDKKLAELK